ncbi:MAG: permease of phosphate ABC transporter [Clostridia bacterium]
MKKLFDYANKYAKKSTWKEFALVKCCVCAIGVIIGVLLPDTVKIQALIIAGIVFVVTYIPLMAGFIKILRNKE